MFFIDKQCLAEYQYTNNEVSVSPDGGGEVSVEVQGQTIVEVVLVGQRASAEVGCLIHSLSGQVPQNLEIVHQNV